MLSGHPAWHLGQFLPRGPCEIVIQGNFVGCEAKQRAKLASLSPHMGYLPGTLGPVTHSRREQGTAAATAAGTGQGSRPVCEGRAEAGGLPLGALVSSHSPPRSLTSSVGRLAKSPGSVRGFLPEQALGHLAKGGKGDFQTQAPETRGHIPSSEMPEDFKKKGGRGARAVVVVVLCYLKIENARKCNFSLHLFFGIPIREFQEACR